MHSRVVPAIWLALPALVGGCGVSPLAITWPEARPLASEYERNLGDTDPGDDSTAGVEPNGPLTLDDALQLAMANHPALASYAWELRARDARAEQAGRMPNPELALEVENFAGSGDLSGFDGAETTISLSQIIPGGNRIERAVRAAELNRDLAGWDYETTRIDVATTTARRFLDVLIAQRRINVAEQNLELAEHLSEIAARRVAAGDVPPSEQARADVAAASARISVAQTRLDLANARASLVSQWGGTEAHFTLAEGELESVAAAPDLADLLEPLVANPEYARWATEVSWRRARLAFAESLTQPDLTMAGGVRYLGESDDLVLVALLSVPLPIADRNRGGIREARAELTRAGHERRLAVIGLRLALTRAHGDLQSAHLEADALRQDVLPAARGVLDAANRAYEQGQIGWLEELDAQRTLIELESRYLDALASYHRTAITIEGLIGQSLASLRGQQNTTATFTTDEADS